MKTKRLTRASVPLTDSVRYCLWRQNALAVVNIQRGFALIDSYTKGAEHNVWRSLNKQIKIAWLSPAKVTKSVRLARRFISHPFNLFQLVFFPLSFSSQLTFVCFWKALMKMENWSHLEWRVSIRKHNTVIMNVAILHICYKSLGSLSLTDDGKVRLCKHINVSSAINHFLN